MKFQFFHVFRGKPDLVFETSDEQRAGDKARSIIDTYHQSREQYHYASQNNKNVSLKQLALKARPYHKRICNLG